MAESVFRCNICRDNKVYTSIEAIEHKKETRHNSWRLIKKGMIRDTKEQ